jgi:hypothetical protein
MIRDGAIIFGDLIGKLGVAGRVREMRALRSISAR